MLYPARRDGTPALRWRVSDRAVGRQEPALLHHRLGAGETGPLLPRLLLPAMELGGQGQVWRARAGLERFAASPGDVTQGTGEVRDSMLDPSHRLSQCPL